MHKRMFFDIGANMGSWALANVDKCEKIISVEASPPTFQTLSQVCKHDKIVLLNYAVCNNDGKDITFYHADCHVLSTINKEWLTSQTSRFYNERYHEITCKTITIDSLIQQYGVPSLIKIDVEGGEYECVTSLTTKVDTLCFEWASEVNDITFKCLDYLFTLGFSQFCVQNGDDYTFRPIRWYDIEAAKTILKNTTLKIDWGMVWCK
jgi:FkbM family methyltransferase